MTDLPKPDVFDVKFQEAKRYRRLKIKNYTGGEVKVIVDVDRTNTLIVTVFPSSINPQEANL